MSPSRQRLLLAAVMSGLLLAMLDQTIVGTALPRIVRDLGGASLYLWLVSAYLVPATVSVPIYAAGGPSGRRVTEDELGRLERHVELRRVADVVEHDPVGVQPGAEAGGGSRPGQQRVLGPPDDPHGAGDVVQRPRPLGVREQWRGVAGGHAADHV